MKPAKVDGRIRICPECAKRRQDEEFTERVDEWMRKMRPVLEKKEAQARKLIAAGFDDDEIADLLRVNPSLSDRLRREGEFAEGGEGFPGRYWGA